MKRTLAGTIPLRLKSVQRNAMKKVPLNTESMAGSTFFCLLMSGFTTNASRLQSRKILSNEKCAGLVMGNLTSVCHENFKTVSRSFC